MTLFPLNFLWTWSGSATSYDGSSFSILRNIHSAFYKGCTSLKSHQECTCSLFSTPSYTLASFAFFIIATLVGMQWYFIVVLICLSLMITADGDCSHEIKRCLLLGRKVMTNLDSIFKSRDITLPTKICLIKAMVFPVVMYGCESWTVKKV